MSCSFCHRERSVVARGLCNACYQRMRKHGSPEYRKRERAVCEVPGCGDPVVSHGLCDKHRQRLRKHGHLGETRPDTWGARSRHPLGHTWKWILRKRGIHGIALEWQEDFLQFARDVGERPSPKHKLFAADESRPIGPDNFVWKRSLTERAQGEDDRTYAARQQRVYRRLKPEEAKNADLKRFYGITVAEYDDMVSSQGGLCAVCGKPEANQFRGQTFALSVDHCHRTGKVRGLLCSACNTGLGLLKDDPEILRRAIAYLERHRED